MRVRARDKKNKTSMMYFIAFLCQKKRKMQKLGWVDLLAVVLWQKNKRGGGVIEIEGVIHCILPQRYVRPKLKSQPRLCINKACWR